MTRTACRCSRRTCRLRKTLARHPDDYTRPPRCPLRNCDGFLRPDAQRARAQQGDRAAYRSSIGELCRCGGEYEAPHIFRGGRDGNAPHRRGSIGCTHYHQPEHTTA